MPTLRLSLTLAGGIALLIGATFLALSVGTVTLTVPEVFVALTRGDATVQAEAVIWSIRLPRVLVAMFVGAALATVGAVMQAILRNPLAEPGITGVSAGAAVGAVATITLLQASGWLLPVAAFIGALIVALLLLVILHLRRDVTTNTIILVGVSLNALAGALIQVLVVNAPNDAIVRGALFWLAGDLDLRTWQHVGMATVPIVLGIALLLTRTRALDALALGEQVALTSGVNVMRERIILLLIASLVTGAAVAVAGIISFVGLVVPHAVRLVIGATHSRLLIVSALGGAVFMVLADAAARLLSTGATIQTGIIASLIGAPVFLFLLLRRRAA